MTASPKKRKKLFLRRVRRRVDTENKLINTFFGQYCQKSDFYSKIYNYSGTLALLINKFEKISS